MNAQSFFRSMIQSQKQGEAAGICSVCSAHPMVIEAAMEYALEHDRPLLLEATANQINQLGGYMGMIPSEFRDIVFGIADKVGLPRASLILGGDHLGPIIWNGENEETAMPMAEELVRSFASAGFSKIHLDTSMHLADDDSNIPLPVEVIARRAALLCKAAEQSADELPVYVIGSEVPPPGGATENEEVLQVTAVQDLRETIQSFENAFREENLMDAWKRVIAVVVQPGVEFSDNTVTLYNRKNAEGLTKYIREIDSLVLEGHSTDYQPGGLLSQMKEDGIAILKVGPELTFALREALFALEKTERELYAIEPEGGWSGFAASLDEAMLENPVYWSKHYHGSAEETVMQRKYSLSDRCRYYLSNPGAEAALEKLRENLKREIPLGLLMQYMPEQAKDVISGKINPDFDSLVKARVKDVIDKYEK